MNHWYESWHIGFLMWDSTYIICIYTTFLSSWSLSTATSTYGLVGWLSGACSEPTVLCIVVATHQHRSVCWTQAIFLHSEHCPWVVVLRESALGSEKQHYTYVYIVSRGIKWLGFTLWNICKVWIVTWLRHNLVSILYRDVCMYVQTSDSFSKKSFSFEWVEESPKNGLDFSSSALTFTSIPSTVVNLPPRLECSHSNSRDGIDSTEVSDCG